MESTLLEKLVYNSH